MKKSVLLLLLILPLLSFSQDALTFKSTSRVFNSDNQKLTPSEIRDLFASNPKALRLYNIGMTKKTIGNGLLYGGISGIIITHLIRVTDSNTTDQYGRLTIKTRSNAMYFVSAGIVLIAIPIKIGFSKKIKRAVSIMNQELKNPQTGFNIESTSFISNSNGIGFSITF